MPILAYIAQHAPHGRDGALHLLAAMCRSDSERWDDPETCSGAVRAEVVRLRPDLLPLLTDPDPAVRRATTQVAAV